MLQPRHKQYTAWYTKWSWKLCSPDGAKHTTAARHAVLDNSGSHPQALMGGWNLRGPCVATARCRQVCTSCCWGCIPIAHGGVHQVGVE
jgi:hypothetical protein